MSVSAARLGTAASAQLALDQLKKAGMPEDEALDEVVRSEAQAFLATYHGCVPVASANMGSTLWSMFGEEIASNATKKLKKQKIKEAGVVLSISLAGIFMADAHSDDVIEDEPIHTIAHAVVDSSDTKRLSYLSTYPRLGLVYCHVLHFKDKATTEEVFRVILTVRDKARSLADSTRSSILESVRGPGDAQQPPVLAADGSDEREQKEARAIQAKVASLMGGTLVIAEGMHYMGSAPVLVRKGHPCVVGDLDRATNTLMDRLRVSPTPRRRSSFGKGQAAAYIDPIVGRPVVLVVSSEGVRSVDSLSREESHRAFVKDLVFWSEVSTKKEKSLFAYIASDPRLNAATCHVFRCCDRAQGVQLRESIDKASRTEREVETLQKGRPFMPTSNTRYTLQKNALSPFEIPRADLVPVRPIGAGQFGLVFYVRQRGRRSGNGGQVPAQVSGGPRSHGDHTAGVSASASGGADSGDESSGDDRAVKALRQGASQDDLADFLREAQTMVQLDHENIVRIRGVCLAQQPWLLVLDLMQYGDLDHVLRTCREKELAIPLPELLLFALQIAKGMACLSAKGFVHLDLAARNCLLHTNNVVKIADFGAARQLPPGAKELKLAEVPKVATRWLAIETMDHRIASERSDVWAFGVTCWEILTQGEEPYRETHFMQVQRRVREGMRLLQPFNCPDTVFATLSACWHSGPAKRPSFAELVRAFTAHHEAAVCQEAKGGKEYTHFDVGLTLALMTTSDV